MSNSDDKPEPVQGDELGIRERISFRDYPSTGWVVLAALVSGLSWLVHKRSGSKRKGQSRPPTAKNKQADLS